MSRRDPGTRDLVHERVRLCDDVRVWPVRERGETVYRLEIPSLHRFFRVGAAEYVLISLLDGQTSLPQACGLAAARLKARAPTAAEAEAIVRWLLSNDLAYLVSQRPPDRGHLTSPRQDSFARGRGMLGRERGWLRRLNPFWMKVKLPAGERWLQSTANILRPLLSPVAVAIGVGIISLALIQFMRHGDSFLDSSREVLHYSNLIPLFATWVGLKLIHELGHAIACARNRSEVQEVGIVFVLFAPLAYVDVSSCWRLSSRWSRIGVSAAGMYVELVLAALAFLGWTQAHSPVVKDLLYNIVVAASFSTLLFNANPLMRFDGYFILADLVEIPNLYSEGVAATKRLAKRFLFGISDELSQLVGWRHVFVHGYGVAALLWRIVICVSLVITASVMFSGGGVLIAVVGVCCWFLPIAKKCLEFVSGVGRFEPLRMIRGLLLGAAMTLLGFAFIFGYPISSSIRLPAIVHFKADSVVRCQAPGFVKSVHVADGDWVESGTLLLAVENLELMSQIDQLQVQRHEIEQRIDVATDGHEPAKRFVLEQAYEALGKRLATLQRQASHLRVVAPHSGVIVGRHLSSLVGTYLNEGETILVVDGVDGKEVFALVEQSLVDDVRGQVQMPVEIRTAAFELTPGTLERVEPKAENLLLHPALAANNGGALAVREDSESQETTKLRLVEPYFQARIQVTPSVSKQLHAGMRTEVFVGHRSATLASRSRESIVDFWRTAKKAAQTETR